MSRLFPTSVLTASGSRVTLSHDCDGVKSIKNHSTPTRFLGINSLDLLLFEQLSHMIDELWHH